MRADVDPAQQGNVDRHKVSSEQRAAGVQCEADRVWLFTARNSLLTSIMDNKSFPAPPLVLPPWQRAHSMAGGSSSHKPSPQRPLPPLHSREFRIHLTSAPAVPCRRLVDRAMPST